MRLSLPRANYTEAEDVAAFYQRLMAELASLPGVTRVGAVSNLPMTDGQSNGCNSHTDTDHCQLRIGTTLSRVVTSAL